MSEFLWTTTDWVRGKQVVETLGGVRGNAIRARHLGRDILAGLKGLVGGEIHDYTALLAQAREQALDRMFDEALRLGANAVIEVRFASAEVAKCAAEILAYGTAVVLEDED